MHRPNIRRLVLLVLREKGPLTDAELAWWVRDVLMQNPASALRARWELTKNQMVRFAGKVKVTAAGRIQKYWELSPEAAKKLCERKVSCT